MNTKILLLLIGGTSLSFVLILGVMMSIVGNRSSDKTPHTSNRRIVVSESKNSAPRTAPVARPKSTVHPKPDRAQSSPPPSLATEQVATNATDSIQRAQPTPNPTTEDLKTDPATLREFSTLKGELRREIEVLKKDRDAMLRSLAEALAQQPPATIAQEIRSLDDEMAAQTLRYFKAEKRQNALAYIDPKRAERLRRRLRQLSGR